MEKQEPESKRIKRSDTKTESDIGPKPGPSSFTVDTGVRKRKVPKAQGKLANFLDLADHCQYKVLEHLSVND